MARFAPHAGHSPSLGLDLERRRLAHRAARLTKALAAMRRLADAHRDHVPPALALGISDFDRELARVEERLRALDCQAQTEAQTQTHERPRQVA